MKEEVRLRKSLKLFHVVYLGLAWMTPMIYFSIYGIAYQTSGGMLTQAYALAFAAIFFTAYSYGVMARRHTTSGSAYSYTKQSMHPFLGYLVGWALLLDYLFSPIIACLTFGIYLHAQFPGVPAAVWIVLLNAVLAGINILGINFSANLSKLFVWLQIAFIGIFCIYLSRGLHGGMDPLAPFVHTGVSFPTVLAGASIICFSFLGFDSITTMSEETIDSGRTIPKAVMIIIVSAAVIYLIPSYLTQLALPHLHIRNLDSAGFEVVRLAGGAALSSLFIVVLIMAIFTQGLSSYTSVSRLMYVMGRDSVLPKRAFAYLHPRFNTPVINILIVCAVSLLALTVSLDTAVKFVNFGALTAFIFVNLSVVAQRYIRDGERGAKGTLLYLMFPLTGAGFIGWLLSLLDKEALLMGLAWLAVGIAYRLIRRATPARREARPSEAVKARA